MMKHLEESTNEVKSRQRFSKLIQIMSYLVIWAVALIVFWVGMEPSDSMGYALMVFYLVLPITTLVISIFIGKDTGWSNLKWLMLLFFGFMYMMASYGTFSLANTISFGNVNLPELTDMIPGIICAAIGMLIGTLIKLCKTKKITKRQEI